MFDSIINFLLGMLSAVGLLILVCAGALILFVLIESIIRLFRGDE